jgi:hypothetical protein
MKPLACLVLLAALIAPAPASAQTSDPMKDLKKRFKNQKPAEDASAPAAGESKPAASGEKGSGPAFKSFPPALKAYYAQGPNGAEPGITAKNLDVSAFNLTELVFYLEPWKKDVVAPTGADRASALKLLAAEVKTAAALTEQGDLLLAKGIPRNPRAPNGSIPPIFGFPSLAMRARFNPTPEDKLIDLATIR